MSAPDARVTQVVAQTDMTLTAADARITQVVMQSDMTLTAPDARITQYVIQCDFVPRIAPTPTPIPRGRVVIPRAQNVITRRNLLHA